MGIVFAATRDPSFSVIGRIVIGSIPYGTLALVASLLGLMLKLGRNSRLRESRSVRRDLLVALTGAAAGAGLRQPGVTLLLGGLDVSLALR